MLVSVTASVSKPDLAAAQLHDNTCNPAAQLGICGTLGHWMMKTNAPHPYAISKALALRHLHRPNQQAADSVATPSSSGNQAATGTLACLSTSSFSRSLAAPTSSSTFSPFFQTWRSGLRQVRTAPRRPPRQRLPSAAQAWLTQRSAGQGRVRTWNVGIALMPASADTACDRAPEVHWLVATPRIRGFVCRGCCGSTRAGSCSLSRDTPRSAQESTHLNSVHVHLEEHQARVGSGQLLKVRSDNPARSAPRRREIHYDLRGDAQRVG